MFRAPRPRGEDSPTVPGGGAELSTSLEAVLALSLCAVVTLASMTFLRRSSALGQTLLALQEESLASARRAHVGATPAVTRARPELVFLIVLDGLRADRLDLYGYARETAPNLRALGEVGVVFEHVGSQAGHPLTSSKSWLTGKYPTTLMFEATGADLVELSVLRDPGAYLRTTFGALEGTLARAFRERGYRTAAFADGPWFTRAAGFGVGFEHFDESGGGLAAAVPHALAWLAGQGGRPTLLLVHAGDLRAPFAAPPPFDHVFCEASQASPADDSLAAEQAHALDAHYDGALLALDAELGRLLEGLRASGAFERALIVVTSGHGQSLGEGGRVGHGGLAPEELAVPLLVKTPASWNLPPKRVAAPVELVDLLPTLLALCALPVPPDLDGRSLVPTLFRGLGGRERLVAQTCFEAGPELRASAALRALIAPERWQVLHDVERAAASFVPLVQGAETDALAIEAAEFGPLMELLGERGRSDARGRGRSAPPVFGAELARVLAELGYAVTNAPDAPAAGSGARDDLR
jgi:hypothetical protein